MTDDEREAYEIEQYEKLPEIVEKLPYYSGPVSRLWWSPPTSKG